MRLFRLAIVISGVLHLVCGCLQIGPRLFERQVRERLKVDECEESQKQRLVNHEKCSIEFLRKYSQSGLIAARGLVAENPGVDEQISNELASDRSSEVRASVAASEYTPRRVLVRLLLDKSEYVRDRLASNGHLTPDEIRALFFTFRQPPLSVFASNPNFPEDIRELVMKRGVPLTQVYERLVRERLKVDECEESQKQRLVNHEKCSIEFLRKYSQSGLLAARALVADNPGVDEQISNELASDRSSEVRASVAASEYTPRRVLVRLLLDKSEYVRRDLASNGHLTHDEIRALFFTFRQPPLSVFASNPNLPEDMREFILKSHDDGAKETLNRARGWGGRGIEIQPADGTMKK